MLSVARKYVTTAARSKSSPHAPLQMPRFRGCRISHEELRSVDCVGSTHYSFIAVASQQPMQPALQFDHKPWIIISLLDTSSLHAMPFEYGRTF